MSDEPDSKPTSSDLPDGRTKRRNWQAAVVAVLGITIVVTLAVVMNLVQARL
jgi:hypothetical protein